MSFYGCNGCNMPLTACTCGSVKQAREDAVLLAEVEAWLRRKYVTSADKRQKALGLSYITAETKDLAKEIARFIKRRES